MSSSPTNSQASYLTTSLYFPEDFEEFRIKILDAYKNIAYATNVREIGFYNLLENLTGQQWFTPENAQVFRQTFRTVYEIGAIAAGATSTTAHGIGTITTFTKIYGTAITAVVDYRPIPYASATAVNTQIEINVDATNITIINGAAAPNITSAIVVLEYLKN